jgi:hypothetical protein
MEVGTRVSIAATGALLAFMGGAEPVGAHPHIWVDAVVSFLFEDGRLVGLRHHWKFDEFFGSFVIEEHDVNRVLLAGMMLVAAIAAGMAITMGGLGTVSVVACRAVAGRIAAGADREGRFAIAMDYAGALAITALGGGLFLAAW